MESSDNQKLTCSFCGKNQEDVKKLIAGPSVYICDECVDLCNDIIEEEIKADELNAFKKNTLQQTILLCIGGLFMFVIGNYAPSEFMQHMIVFALACFVGFQVIWNVSHALHTPLMAVTNAISGIIIIGAVLQMTSESWIAIFLAAISVLISTINIVGGFLVTRRMLAMFQKS